MKGIVLQDYSPHDGFTTWLAFLTTRTRREMNHAIITAAFREQFKRAPEVVLCLPGHWRAGPLTEQDEKEA